MIAQATMPCQWLSRCRTTLAGQCKERT
jgi:hypothetical protein